MNHKVASIAQKQRVAETKAVIIGTEARARPPAPLCLAVYFITAVHYYFSGTYQKRQKHQSYATGVLDVAAAPSVHSAGRTRRGLSTRVLRQLKLSCNHVITDMQ